MHKGKMEGKMAHKGYNIGDMSPTVENFEHPKREFAERDFSKTTQYIERRNHYDSKQASELKKQDYKGRYS